MPTSATAERKEQIERLVRIHLMRACACACVSDNRQSRSICSGQLNLNRTVQTTALNPEHRGECPMLGPRDQDTAVELKFPHLQIDVLRRPMWFSETPDFSTATGGCPQVWEELLPPHRRPSHTNILSSGRVLIQDD
jgi:hypothetical protein